MQSQETQAGRLVSTARYTEYSAFPFGKAVSAPSCARSLRLGSPKIFYPSYTSCHIPGCFNGLYSEIHSLHFTEKRTHVGDEGGMKRLNQSAWRGTLSEHHQLYRQTWAKQFNLALLLLKKKKTTSTEKRVNTKQMVNAHTTCKCTQNFFQQTLQ